MWDMFFFKGALIQNQKLPSLTLMYFSASCIEILFFENFQNGRSELSNSSFDGEFYTEKCYNGTIFDKMNI